MTLSAPTNPIFAHAENKIFASDVDQYLDCVFQITTNGTTKTFNNRVYSYNGSCEINLEEILKMYYYRYEQPLPVPSAQTLNGANNLNGGELIITATDFSDNTQVLTYKVINGALQIGESFDPETDQYLNQVKLKFAGFPSDVTEWSGGDVLRHKVNPFTSVEKCKGVYIAWLNKYGAYDYYLFDGHSEMDINSTDVEKFRGFSLGKKSNRVIKIRANVIEDLQNYTSQKLSPQSTAMQITEALLGIIESPEVYIFRLASQETTSGGDFNADFNHDFLIDPYWQIAGRFIKVKSVSGNNKIKFRYRTTPMDFELTLPDEKNITAI